MSENITRTIYGAKLQTAKQMLMPFRLDAIATLNSKFNILADQLPPVDTYPGMRYIAIGNGGHRFQAGTDGIPYPETLAHAADDAALFHHLPFVLRPVGNDISPVERVKYALRRIEQWRGANYIAYYLKRLDFTGAEVEMNFTHVENGQSVTRPFVPDSSNLNPVPRQLSANGINVVNGDYLSASANLGIILDTAAIAEFMAAVEIIYQEDNYAVISEIAICSGIDKVVTLTDPGLPAFNFNEAIAVQVNSFIQAFSALKFNNNGFQLALDCGATEPLFTINGGGGLSGTP